MTATSSETRRNPCRAATQRYILPSMTLHGPRSRGGSGNRRPLWASPNGRGPFYGWPTARHVPPPLDTWNAAHGMSAQGRCALSRLASTVCPTQNDPADGRFFPPVVALYVVKLACERPDVVGRSWAPWESAALARQVGGAGVVEAMSPQTVQRILAAPTLQPWRHHVWLSPTVPREAPWAAHVTAMVTRSTRPLGTWDMVLCVDEKTRVPPRTRTAPPVAAHPGQPGRVEHAYTRTGALNLFAGGVFTCWGRPEPVLETMPRRSH